MSRSTVLVASEKMLLNECTPSAIAFVCRYRRWPNRLLTHFWFQRVAPIKTSSEPGIVVDVERHHTILSCIYPRIFFIRFHLLPPQIPLFTSHLIPSDLCTLRHPPPFYTPDPRCELHRE